MSNLLDASAVAERLGVSKSFAQKLLVRRGIPVVRVGRLTKVREQDLEAWIEARLERPAGARRDRRNLEP